MSIVGRVYLLEYAATIKDSFNTVFASAAATLLSLGCGDELSLLTDAGSKVFSSGSLPVLTCAPPPPSPPPAGPSTVFIQSAGGMMKQADCDRFLAVVAALTLTTSLPTVADANCIIQVRPRGSCSPVLSFQCKPCQVV